MGVRILRLRVDRLVGRGEVGRLEVGIGGVGQRRGTGVGRLTYSAQLGQPCRPVAGAVVTVLEESKTKRERVRNEAQSFSYPPPLNPFRKLVWGKSPIPLRRTPGWGYQLYIVHIGKYPRSEAGLSKKRKEIRICKSRGTAVSPRHSSQRKEGDVKGCPAVHTALNTRSTKPPLSKIPTATKY